MRVIVATLLLLAGLLAAPTVMAQTCTASAPTIDFGGVPTPVPQTDVATPMTISCSGGNANATVRICVGIQPSTSTTYLFGERLLVRGFSGLAYEIYADPGRTQRWDDTPLRLVQVPLNAGGSGSTTVTMYARLFAGGSPANGAYDSEFTDDTVFGAIKPGNSGCNSGSSTGSFTGSAFNATAFVGGNCIITADPLLDFGSVMGSTTPQVDSAVALHATCNDQLPYTIALDAGQVPGNTIANRRLGLNGTGPGVLSYQLYHDAGRSQLWGDGTTGSVHTGTGSGTQQDITVYGRVPAGQAMPAGGTYRDTVTATIIY